MLILTGCQTVVVNNQTVLKINDTELTVDIVKSPQAIAKGLSGRESLCENCGMLFEFPDYQIRYFWMKEMQFPLDIIWVKDDTIVGIAKNVPIFTTNGQIGRVQSSEEVNKVLEVNAGWTESYNVQIGDKVKGLD